MVLTFEKLEEAVAFAKSPEAKVIMAEVIADANPALNRSWIHVSNIEVLSRRLKLETSLRQPATSLKIDYKVFIPRGHSAASFDPESLEGDKLLGAINTKAEAMGMTGVRVTAATNSVLNVETVTTLPPTSLEYENGSVSSMKGTVLAIVAASVASVFTLSQ